jgi:hypothetical protein
MGYNSISCALLLKILNALMSMLAVVYIVAFLTSKNPNLLGIYLQADDRILTRLVVLPFLILSLNYLNVVAVVVSYWVVYIFCTIDIMRNTVQ